MKRFTTTPDDTTYKITYGIMGLCLVIFISIWYANKHVAYALPTPLLLCGIIAAMYLLKPTALVIESDKITIDRKVLPKQIPFSDIQMIKRVPEDDMRFAIRTLGNGGLYGYTGYYYNKAMGSMVWYCTRRSNYVLIQKTSGKKIIITPDDPEAFIAYVTILHPEKVNA